MRILQIDLLQKQRKFRWMLFSLAFAGVCVALLGTFSRQETKNYIIWFAITFLVCMTISALMYPSWFTGRVKRFCSEKNLGAMNLEHIMKSQGGGITLLGELFSEYLVIHYSLSPSAWFISCQDLALAPEYQRYVHKAPHYSIEFRFIDRNNEKEKLQRLRQVITEFEGHIDIIPAAKGKNVVIVTPKTIEDLSKLLVYLQIHLGSLVFQGASEPEPATQPE